MRTSLTTSDEVKFFELFNFICGEELGQGMSRSVHVYKPDPTLVIKIEDSDRGAFQNTQEWLAWENASVRMRYWLAPCVSISGNGRYLIQKRIEPLQKTQYPKTLPAIFTDIKPENFGMYQKRVVCVDYGLLLGTRMWEATDRMKKVRFD